MPEDVDTGFEMTKRGDLTGSSWKPSSQKLAESTEKRLFSTSKVPDRENGDPLPTTLRSMNCGVDVDPDRSASSGSGEVPRVRVLADSSPHLLERAADPREAYRRRRSIVGSATLPCRTDRTSTPLVSVRRDLPETPATTRQPSPSVRPDVTARRGTWRRRGRRRRQQDYARQRGARTQGISAR